MLPDLDNAGEQFPKTLNDLHAAHYKMNASILDTDVTDCDRICTYTAISRLKNDYINCI